jgi:hypothetical protein
MARMVVRESEVKDELGNDGRVPSLSAQLSK